MHTFTLTAHCKNERTGGRFAFGHQDSGMRTRELYTTRAVATQHRRVRESAREEDGSLEKVMDSSDPLGGRAGRARVTVSHSVCDGFRPDRGVRQRPGSS
eukprot:3665814-Prymnesium_polylepis.1